MSIISQTITAWRHGLTIIFLLALFGILAPLATVMVISALIIFPMFVLGFDLTFWDENADGVGYLALAILGPYYIGAHWDEIQNTIRKILSSST